MTYGSIISSNPPVHLYDAPADALPVYYAGPTFSRRQIYGTNGVGWTLKQGGVTAYRDASLLVSRKGGWRVPVGGGMRGGISSFSAASRRRLMCTLNRIRTRSALPRFLTLTRPDAALAADGDNASLVKFVDNVRHRYPRAAAIWKREVVTRKSGAAVGVYTSHYHLLVWGFPDDAEVRQAWASALGISVDALSEDANRSEMIRSRRGTMRYATKYMGKDVSNCGEFAGRWWGVWGRAYIEWGTPIEYPMSEAGAAMARDALGYSNAFIEQDEQAEWCEWFLSIATAGPLPFPHNSECEFRNRGYLLSRMFACAGIVPELGSREWLNALALVADAALRDARSVLDSFLDVR